MWKASVKMMGIVLLSLALLNVFKVGEANAASISVNVVCKSSTYAPYVTTSGITRVIGSARTYCTYSGISALYYYRLETTLQKLKYVLGVPTWTNVAEASMPLEGSEWHNPGDTRYFSDSYSRSCSMSSSLTTYRSRSVWQMWSPGMAGINTVIGYSNTRDLGCRF